MSILPYFLIPALIVLIGIIKLVFKNSDEFSKALAYYFFPDDLVENPLKDWAQKTDAAHKIDILYAAILGLVLINLAIYFLFITSESFIT